MIYFDNAATTFPKPTQVIDEVKRCMVTYGGNPGRGAHSLSLRAAKVVYACRELAAQMFGAASAERVFFTPNTTYGINAAIKGLLRHGDHVLISDMEHNAVYRPIYKMAEEGKIEYDIFPTFAAEGVIDSERLCHEIAVRMKSNTRMVVCTHSSNICSYCLPIAEIGELCRQKGVLFVVDGAQSAGHERIDVSESNIDVLCLPGHKGLYGPQGSGMVVLGEDIILDTLIEGGNGIDSLSAEMTQEAPERYEAGTVATPCIAGLYEGLKYVWDRGEEEIAYAEQQLCKRALELLCNTRGITVYAPQYHGSIVLFNAVGIPSEEIAAQLDAQKICVRSGFHCAALAHHTLGTPDSGAVRLSFGMFNTSGETERFYKALKSLLH